MAAEGAAAASRQREEAARAQGREFAERARRAETLCEEAEAELAQVRYRQWLCVPYTSALVLLLCCSAFCGEGGRLLGGGRRLFVLKQRLGWHTQGGGAAGGTRGGCQPTPHAHSRSLPHSRAQVRSQLELAQASLSELKTSRAEAAAQLAAREAAVESLTTLSLRGDATVQEYVTQVKVSSLQRGAAHVFYAPCCPPACNCRRSRQTCA